MIWGQKRWEIQRDGTSALEALTILKAWLEKLSCMFCSLTCLGEQELDLPRIGTLVNYSLLLG